MRHAFYATLTILCFYSLSAAQVDSFGSATFHSYYGKEMYESVLTPELLERTPTWLDGQDNPPLSARRAVEVASACLAELFPDAGKWGKAVIHLRPVGGKWIYVIEFDKPTLEDVRKGITSHPSFSVIVLMNGEAVKPMRRKLKSA